MSISSRQVVSSFCLRRSLAALRANGARAGHSARRATRDRHRDAHPTPIEEVLASVVVIDRDEIERSLAGDAADLLRFHAGLDIARTGGPGQTTSLFMRGAESNHTLVMVDGVRINPGTIGSPALQNLAPELIERIEVVKGPRSALYGTDAIGGVVNVITRRGSLDGWSAQARIRRLRHARGKRRRRCQQATRGRSTWGCRGSTATGFPTRSDDTIDRGFDNLSLNLGGSTVLGAAEMTARIWHAEGNTEYSDFFLAPVDQDFDNSAASLSGAVAPVARVA